MALALLTVGTPAPALALAKSNKRDAAGRAPFQSAHTAGAYVMKNLTIEKFAMTDADRVAQRAQLERVGA